MECKYIFMDSNMCKLGFQMALETFKKVQMSDVKTHSTTLTMIFKLIWLLGILDKGMNIYQRVWFFTKYYELVFVDEYACKF